MDPPELAPIQHMESETAVSAAGAVERCYRDQADRLWRALLLFAGDREVASDAVAEAFAQALRRGGEVRDFDRWVWRAAFALARGELKRRGRVTSDVPELPEEMPPTTVDIVRALRRLPPKQRAAVVLHHYAGYSNRETALLIGSTAAAVGVHLQRARSRLRRILEENDE